MSKRDDAKDITFTFDGVNILGKVGDTFASALVNAGVYALKESVDGERRGVFCGMGVCNECAVVVDGVAGKLACMIPAVDGAVVEHQPAYPEVALNQGVDAQAALQDHQVAPEVLVIGAGPAGLAATAVIAEAGIDVILIDERGKLGGQYFKQPADSFLSEEPLDEQFREGQELINRVKATSARILSGASVWGAFSPNHLMATNGSERWIIRPQRLIIATGAYERGVPASGWTTPGVMTTGAAQTLLRSYQVPLGSRAFISGNGPLNFQVAAELVRAKSRVVGLAESSNPFRLVNILSGLALAWYSPSLVLKGIGYLVTLKRAKVPVFFSSAAAKFVGDTTLREMELQKLDHEGNVRSEGSRTFSVDAVALGFGFMPSNEIARSLGCKHIFDAKTKSLKVEHDEFGRTTVKDVQVIGDCGGVSGAQVAKAAGVLAGSHIVDEIGLPLSESLIRERTAAKRSYRRNLRFQKHLWKIFASPVIEFQFCEPTTTICRCLSLTKDEIDNRVTEDTLTAGALKRLTRAGMGICQGKYCGPLIVSIASEHHDFEVDEYSGFASQAPFRPTKIEALAEFDPLK